MFRIVRAELTVKDGSMKAAVTLGGKGYLKLFMGTGEEALDADPSQYIGFSEDADGTYTYELPVEALDQLRARDAVRLKNMTYRFFYM